MFSSKERMETNYQKYSKKDLVKLIIKRDAEVDMTVDLLRRNDVSLSSLFEDVEEYVIEVTKHRILKCLKLIFEIDFT